MLLASGLVSANENKDIEAFENAVFTYHKVTSLDAVNMKLVSLIKRELANGNKLEEGGLV